jgi:hypothetical protein
MAVTEEVSQAMAQDPSLYDAGTLPSWSRFPRLPAAIPKTRIAEDTNIEAIATAFIKNFPALEARNFTTNALWRDTFALTGTLRTFYSAKSITTAWNDVSNSRAVKDFTLVPNSARIIRFGSDSAWVQVQFEFKTTAVPAATCSGFLSLVPDTDGEWKIWILRTILEQIEGQENVDVLQPESSLTNGSANGVNGSANGVNGHTNGVNGLTNGHAVNGTETNGHAETPTHYDCLLVGAGQTGLSLGGRLKALGASYLVVDTMSQIGDSWAKRYESTKRKVVQKFQFVHMMLRFLQFILQGNTVKFIWPQVYGMALTSTAHFPFERSYTSEFQEYLSKNDLAKGHQRYAKKFNIVRSPHIHVI